MAAASRYAGVSNNARYNPKRPWVARASVDGRSHLIGGFADERSAAIARDRMVLFYGSDSVLNFPRDHPPREPRALRGDDDEPLSRSELEHEPGRVGRTDHRRGPEILARALR